MTNMILVALVQVSVLGANQQDFDQAYHESLKRGRPLVVLVGAAWCPACQKMKHSIVPEVAKTGGLNKVVFTCVDFDQQRQLASRLTQGGSIPQLIRFDQTPAAGWKSKRLVGARSARDVHDFINAGLIDESKASQDSATDRPRSKSAPGESVRPTPAASKSGACSSVDDPRGRQQEIGPFSVGSGGDFFHRMVLFKKLLPESKNGYHSTVHEESRSGQATENGEADQSPGPKEAGARGSQSAGAGAEIAGLLSRLVSGSPASPRDSPTTNHVQQPE